MRLSWTVNSDPRLDERVVQFIDPRGCERPVLASDYHMIQAPCLPGALLVD